MKATRDLVTTLILAFSIYLDALILIIAFCVTFYATPKLDITLRNTGAIYTNTSISPTESMRCR